MSKVTVIFKTTHDKGYVGPGIYLCYGPTQAEHIYAKNFDAAIAKSGTSDIVSIKLAMVCNSNEEFMNITLSAHQLKAVLGSLTATYIYDTSNGKLEQLRTNFTSSQVSSIIDTIQDAFSDDESKDIIQNIRIKYYV